MVTENGMHDLKLPLLSIGVTLNHAFCYASCIHELFTTEMVVPALSICDCEAVLGMQRSEIHSTVLEFGF